MNHINLFANLDFRIFLPLVIFLISLIAGYILSKILILAIEKTGKTHKKQLGLAIIKDIKAPFIILFMMFGLYFARVFSDIPANLGYIADKILLVLGIFSITWIVAGLSGRMITAYSGKFRSELPIASLIQNVVSIVVFTTGILIIINSLGVSITPILATLGVGGLAIALALQDTLSNLFAGFHIILARQVKLGDYIKLDSGEEGYVVDINWRTTKIKMLPNNEVLVPNAKLIQVIVTNFCLPSKEMAVLVDLGVHYMSDLNKVEKVTCEVANEVMREVRGGVPEFNTFIRFHTFGDFSINFTVILRAKEFVDKYLIKHEFIKRLHVRYAKENIVIPYPIRSITYEQDGQSSGHNK